MSAPWPPDPEFVFWQAAAGSPPDELWVCGERPEPPAPGDGDPEPPAAVLGPSVTGCPETIEVTGLGDPVRSFIQREPSLAEPAEFRAAWLLATRPPDPAEKLRIAIEAASPLRCGDCGLDDRAVDSLLRCTYCAELAGLRARNLPGPPLAAWWYLLPCVLGFTLGLVAVWAVLYVIFCG